LSFNDIDIDHDIVVTYLMSVKVSSKYQVVIPERVRVALGLKPGTQVDVIAKGGIAFLVPIKSVAELRKTLSNRLNSEDVATARDKRDRKI
jgi:AbrB family looped-hinge helix DNA binding protein